MNGDGSLIFDDSLLFDGDFLDTPFKTPINSV